MKFRFRLQAVLDLREREEQRAKIALGEAQRRVFEVDEQIARLEAAQTGALAALPPNAPFGERLAARAWADKLAAQVARLRYERETLSAVAATKQQEVATAQAERRAVEKLRERALAEYQAEVLRREQITLDEIATSRYAQKS